MVVTALGLLLGERADAGACAPGNRRRGSTAAGSCQRTAPSPSACAMPGETSTPGPPSSARSLGARARAAVARSRRRPQRARRCARRTRPTLVVVHGQSDQIRLRSATAQREALDRFAGAPLAALLEDYRTVFTRWRTTVDAARDAASTTMTAVPREAEDLRLAMAEIETVAPAARARTSNWPSAPNGSATSRTCAWPRRSARERALGRGVATTPPMPSALLDAARAPARTGRRARRRLGPHRRVARQRRASWSPTSRPNSRATSPASTPTAPASSRSCRSGVPSSPAWCASTAPTSTTCSRRSRRAASACSNSTATPTASTQLERRCRRRRAAVVAARRASSRARAHGGGEQARPRRSPTSSRPWPWPTPQLVVEVDRARRVTASGRDQSSILLQPHSGAEPRPLGKGASGGELSRVMLAIEVVIAGDGPGARPSSSTRSTPVSAVPPRSRSAAGWPGSPRPRRSSSSRTWPRSPHSPPTTSASSKDS